MTVQDKRGPGLDFFCVFCVWQASVRGCCFYFVFVYFVIKVFECSPVLLISYLRTVTLSTLLQYCDVFPTKTKY